MSGDHQIAFSTCLTSASRYGRSLIPRAADPPPRAAGCPPATRQSSKSRPVNNADYRCIIQRVDGDGGGRAAQADRSMMIDEDFRARSRSSLIICRRAVWSFSLCRIMQHVHINRLTYRQCLPAVAAAAATAHGSLSQADNAHHLAGPAHARRSAHEAMTPLVGAPSQNGSGFLYNTNLTELFVISLH